MESGLRRSQRRINAEESVNSQKRGLSAISGSEKAASNSAKDDDQSPARTEQASVRKGRKRRESVSANKNDAEPVSPTEVVDEDFEESPPDRRKKKKREVAADDQSLIAMEGSSNSRNDSLVWTDAQVEYLINILVQQSHIPGMKSGGNFKPKSYKAIEQKMIEKYGPDFTIEKIKNKLKSTKADYNTCKQILATSGFGWDPTNKCVDVDNEVWAVYIQKFPDRQKFKGGQKWKHYEELHELYGQSTATGRDSYNCTSYMMTEDYETNHAPETPITHTPDFGINVDENVPFTQMLNSVSPIPSPTHVEQDSQPTTSESRTTNSSNKRARLNTNEEEYRTILHDIADSFRTIINTSTIQAINKSAVILREMLDSGEIDDDMHLRALMLMEQRNKPITFLNLKPTERVRWLLLNLSHQ